MAAKAISGVELWHNTELGKALRKVLPPELTRVIIDIGIDSPVSIYYASLDTGPIVDLKWDEIIERCEVVKPKEAGHIDGLMTELEYYGNHNPDCDMANVVGGKCTCGLEQAIKGETQYVCARCEYRTSDKDVMAVHSAVCKVPLNGYGG